MSITRLYSEDLPQKPYQTNYFKDKPNLHNGQRKLLISEIDFLNRCYSKYDNTTPKILLYIGASPGQHVNYLVKMFPDLQYELYDSVDSRVKTQDNINFHHRYFDDTEAEKYVNKNVLLVCDIRGLDVKKNVTDDPKTHKHMEEVVYADMVKQMNWCKTIKPKAALLKFRLAWGNSAPQTTYFGGDIFFQAWAGNESTELRLIPDLNSVKTYNNKVYEQVCFYHNAVTRREKLNKSDKKNSNNYSCIGEYHDSEVEGRILAEYLRVFMKTPENEIQEKVCDLSISITISLEEYGSRNKISERFLKSAVVPVRLKT